MVIGESVEVVLPRNPENAEKLTPEYASLVFFNSFRHSQGIPIIQRDIFSYVHIIRPKWKISPEDKPKILEISQNMILSFLYGEEDKRKEGVILHDSYPPKNIAIVEIINRLGDMEDKFNDKEKPTPEKKRELIQKISESITSQDLDFLNRENGRERNPDSKKPLMDPWLSFIVHFGLNKNSTEVPEFDEMYRDIRAFITRPGAEINQFWLNSFTETLNIYRKKHRGVKINLEP
jgi:hypothetical protein